jgi:tetratricopeptide (TPR) repeat protein
MLAGSLHPCAAAEGAAGLSSTGKVEEAISQEMRTYLQLQEQLHATQLAVERSRNESAEAAKQTAELLAARIQSIEQSLNLQRAHELDAMESSNRTMLLVAGSFASLGFVALLMMGYFQWRTVSRLADFSAALASPSYAVGSTRSVTELGSHNPPLLARGTAQDSKTDFLATVERLEKRIFELEHGAPAVAQHAHQETNGDEGSNGGATPENGLVSDEHGRVELLLAKGQVLLDTDKAEQALACFDEALALNSRNADALVKKGTALERLRKINEAIACYDQAIEADGSMTIAYLYKGGLCNRLERFNEALECYERALRTQEKRTT